MSKRTLCKNKSKSLDLELMTIITACFLITSIFTAIPLIIGGTQPPIDKSTYYVGAVDQPSRLDPARAYDTASGEIIQNVYQPLIWYGDKHPISFTAGVGYNLQTSDIADLSVYVPMIATQVPTDTNGGIIRNYTGVGDELWTFTLNTNAQFTSWTAANGTVVPAHSVTVDDVVYSFQRQLVYDSDASPDWMWIESAFNPNWVTFSSAFSDFANGTFVDATVEGQVAALMQGWVYPSSGNNVAFHFLHPYADVAMYQIFAATWGSILEKSWVIEHGGWNGTFYNGWSNDYRRKPSNSYSELDQYKDPAVYGGAHGSKYTSPPHDIPDMLGTGPYLFTSWDKTTSTWRIDYNSNYWKGWTSAGDKGGNYIKTVIETGVAAWPTRKMLFQEGEFDECAVPRTSMNQLLTSTYNPIAGIDMAYNIPTLVNDALFFTMNVSAASPYQSFVGYPTHTTGQEALFFADQHIRKAFAWAIDYAAYISSAYGGEAIQHGSWWVTGLTPTGANDSFLTLRNLNSANMMTELNSAAPIEGHSVSQEGFDVTFLYDTGNLQRMIACQAFANAWNSLNSKYHVNVVGVAWSTFSSLLASRSMPGYADAWLADFGDAADFAGTYMASSASSWFSYFQGPPYPADQAIIDAEVTQAATGTSATARVNAYHELEYRYWVDCISISLDQPVGRRFARDWVQGWYYNPLLPGLYAYDLYKFPSVAGTLWDPSRDSYSEINYGSFWSGGGNCYGLSTTAVLYFMNSVLGNTSYPYIPLGATSTSKLILPPPNPATGLVDVLNNAGLAVMFHQVYAWPGWGPPDFDKLMAALESGTPAAMSVYDTTSGAAHEVVAYGAILNSDGTVSIKVSDPNHPKTEQTATYNLTSKAFSYQVDFNYSVFDVTTPEEILNHLASVRSWNFGNSKWYGNWLSKSVPNYYIVVASGMVRVFKAGASICKPPNLPLSNAAYFKSAGNSNTFVNFIPGCCGIEEGNVQVYAIPSNTFFSVVDPGSNESTILVTLVDNESGQLVGSGYFLNATTTQGFLNYTVSPSSSGLSLSTGDNGLNASVTFFSATKQDYSVSEPLNVQVDPAQTVNFTALYVTDLVPSKNIIGQGSNVPVNVTILSTAGSPEFVGLTVFANTTAIDTEIMPSLPNGASTHSFVWNTSGLAYGNYTITALTRVFTNDTTMAGGNCTFQTTVSISIVGDINGDGTVDILDAIVLAGVYGKQEGQERWNPDANLNMTPDPVTGKQVIDIFDAIVIANHFNQHYP